MITPARININTDNFWFNSPFPTLHSPFPTLHSPFPHFPISHSPITMDEMKVAKPDKSKLSTTEFNSLYDFYNATNGPYWIWHNVSINSVPWNFSIPDVNPCWDNWQGLQCSCDATTCSVSKIFLDHHHLTGHLPDSMENFDKMSILVLRGNNITHPITRSIGNMTELQELDLSYNLFDGEIPPSIGRLSQLQTLNLGVNRLTRIPDELYDLSNLEALSLFNNRIEGILSPRIGNLSSLQTLQLQLNNFTSQPIPPQLCDLRQLKTLDMSHTLFHGPIPDCLYHMTSLISLTMIGLNMSCTINNAIGNLTNLITLDFSHGYLYGTIPSTLSNLTNLIDLSLNDNYFTNTLPSSMINMKNLQTVFFQQNFLQGNVNFFASMNLSILSLYNNQFNGHFIIPEDGLIDIVYFDISRNLFSGPLPWNSLWKNILIYVAYENQFTGNLPTSTLASLSIVYYVIGQNFITSTIPEGFFQNSGYLYSLELSENLLTGSIPTSLGHFPEINQIILTTNYFTGSLPDFGDNTLMVVLDVASNYLYGTISSSLSRLKYIEELFLHFNSFSGIINQFINATIQRRLVNIDVSQNQFTGTIPTDVFIYCRKLGSFAASSNCFDGSIPTEICYSTELTSLSLDGLTSSTDCRNRLLQGLPYVNGFTVSHFIQGTIPPCLFQMKSLRLLHLSGNGLTGTIADNFNSTPLTQVSLSHNSLSGTIPNSLQYSRWNSIDLSYNKLTGTLRHDFGSAEGKGNVTLEVNRLSGRIPPNIFNYSGITVLSGNIFECNFFGTDLPQKDPDADNYACGSDSVNNVLYSWIVALICIPLFFLIVLKYIHGFHSSIKDLITCCFDCWTTWRSALRKDENRVNLTRLSIYFSEVRQGVLRLAIYCMIVLLVVFSVLKIYSASYTLEYAWTTSAMLMNGETAAIVLFLSLAAFAVLYVLTSQHVVRKLNLRMPKEKKHQDSENLPIDSPKPLKVNDNLLENFIIYSIITLLDVVIMALADFSYVYMVISFNALFVTFAALALALFRLFTNQVILWMSIPWTSKFIRWMTKGKKHNQHRSGRTKSSIEMKIDQEYSINDISFLENLILFNNIIIPGLAIVFILPDCFYNALFAADAISSSYPYESCYQYTPVLEQNRRCETYGGLVQYSPPYIYSYQCSSKIVINYVPVYVLMFILAGVIIPCLKFGLKLVYDQTKESEGEGKNQGNPKIRRLIELFLPEYFKDFQSDIKPALTEGRDTLTSETMYSRTIFIGGEKKKLLFSKLTMTIHINSYLTILMCFGALFPPLALIAVLTIFSITYFEELWIGWLLTETRNLGLGYMWYEEQIERECEGIEESSNLTIWSTLIVSCGLYGYIIFDTMGDTSGWEEALPMSLLMMLFPLFFMFVFGLRSRCSFVALNRDVKDSSLTTKLVSDHTSFSDNEVDNPLNRRSSLQMVSTNHSRASEVIE